MRHASQQMALQSAAVTSPHPELPTDQNPASSTAAQQLSSSQPAHQMSTSTEAKSTPVKSAGNTPLLFKTFTAQQDSAPVQPDSIPDIAEMQASSASRQKLGNVDEDTHQEQGVTAGSIMTPQTKQLAAAYIPRRQQQEPSYLDRKVRKLQASTSRRIAPWNIASSAMLVLCTRCIAFG